MTSRDDLRIGDSDRNEAMSALREHFAQGRITHEELDERLDATLRARTAGDLKIVTADLPGPLGEEPQARAYGWSPRGLPPQGPMRHGPAPYGWGHSAFNHPAFNHAAFRHRHLGRGLRRGGRPPVVLFLFAGLVIASLVTGTAWPLFFMVKLMFTAWIAIAVIGLIRHRRRHQIR